MTTNNRESGSSFGIGAFLLLIESIVVFSLGIYMVVLGFTHDKDWLPYLSVTGFAFAGSVALLALARGFRDGRRWANSPAILANLIALGVAKYQFEAGLYWLATPLSVISFTIIGSVIMKIRKFSH